MSKTEENFHRNFEFRRKQLGLEIDQIAKKLEMPASTLYKYTSGVTGVKLSLLDEIAEVLEITAAGLIAEEFGVMPVTTDQALSIVATALGYDISVNKRNAPFFAIKKEFDSLLSTLDDAQTNDLLRAFRGETTADLVARARDILGLSNNSLKQKKN